MFLLLTAFILFTSCEQERVDDTARLHPFSGQQPIVFALLPSGAETIRVEAQLTVPVYSEEVSAPLSAIDLSLVKAGETYANLLEEEPGFYSGVVPTAIQEDERYHLDMNHADFGIFRSSDFFIPKAVGLTGVDSTSRDGLLMLTGTFGTVPTNIFTSSKLLRYGEGVIVNATTGNSLPIRSAQRSLNEAFNKTEEYIVRPTFTLFDQVTLTPIDTVRVDSVQLILYTWGEEVGRFVTSLAETNQEFGDGSESIDGTSWTNIEGGFGLAAGFSTDTLVVYLR